MLAPMSLQPLDHQDLAALPIFPLPGAALFPGTVLPLHVFEPRYRELTRDALADRQIFAVARLRPGFEADYGGRPAVFEACGAGRIVDHVRYSDGRFDVTLLGLGRVRILNELPPDRSYRIVRAEQIHDLPADAALTAALKASIFSSWHVLAPQLPEALRDLHELTRGVDAAGAFADRLAAMMAGDPDTAQHLLSEPDPCQRLQILAESLQVLTSAAKSAGARSKMDLN
jgi:Lon protease-like protein